MMNLSMFGGGSESPSAPILFKEDEGGKSHNKELLELKEKEIEEKILQDDEDIILVVIAKWLTDHNKN